MSLQSAMAALGSTQPIESSITSKEGSISPSEQVVAPQVSPTPSERLKEAVAPVKQAPKPPGSDRFAALAKKERAIQKQLADIKAREASVKAFESLKASATSNPLEALKALGLSYEQITQYLLNGNKPTPEAEVSQVRQDLEKLKQEQVQREEQAKVAAKQAAEREYQQTLEDFSSEVKGFVQSNKDSYELTNMYQGEEIVLSTIEQHFANTKRIMSIKEAADLVEAYFEEQVKAAQQTKKFQAKQEPKVSEGQPKRESVSKSTPTLSNGLTSSAPSLLPAKTEQARMQRAMAALDKASS
jgi:hypothetical protein